jgi:hypothetical protein
MPGENETLEGGLDAVAQTLLVGGDDTPAPKTPTPNRVAEGEDQVDENDVDNSVDPSDLDLLEDGEEDDAGEETYENDDDGEQGYTDPDDTEHEVVVDGAPTKAKLRDLKAAYSGNKAIEQRVQQASEYRKHSEVMAGELMKQLNLQATRLKQLDTILAQAETPNIDWATLRTTDPQRYLIEKDKQQELANKRAYVQQQEEATRQQQRELQLRKQAEFAAEQAEILVQKIPELKNPEKAKVMGENWNKVGREYGFSDEEISGIIDHRHLLVLTDAMKYRALVAAKQSRQGKNGNVPRQQPKPLLRPGSQNFNSRMNNAKAEKAALAKAAQSGSLDDVAATLLVSAPRPRAKRTGF